MARFGFCVLLCWFLCCFCFFALVLVESDVSTFWFGLQVHTRHHLWDKESRCVGPWIKSLKLSDIFSFFETFAHRIQFVLPVHTLNHQPLNNEFRWKGAQLCIVWTELVYIKLRNTTEHNNMLVGVSPTYFKASSKTLVTQNMFCVQFYLLGTFDGPWLKVSDGPCRQLDKFFFPFWNFSLWHFFELFKENMLSRES